MLNNTKNVKLYELYNEIINVLNQTLPKNLNLLIFKNGVNISDRYSLNFLIDNWKEPRPFKIMLPVNNKFSLEEDLSEKISTFKKFKVISL